jgi:hypothetical protein
MVKSVSVYRIASTVAWQHSADDVAVLDLRSPGEPPSILAGPAAVIWLAIDGQRDGAAVADQVVARIRSGGGEPGMTVADEARIRADVDAFLAELDRRGLVEADPPEG